MLALSPGSVRIRRDSRRAPRACQHERRRRLNLSPCIRSEQLNAGVIPEEAVMTDPASTFRSVSPVPGRPVSRRFVSGRLASGPLTAAALLLGAASFVPVGFVPSAGAHTTATPSEGSAAAADATTGLGQPREASLPFLRHGAVRDWRADGDKGLWVQSNGRRWYYASFLFPCTGLRFADTIGFESDAADRLDRWSRVRVPGGLALGSSCTLRSFTEDEGPPQRRAAR
jgi:hypothetical protein